MECESQKCHFVVQSGCEGLLGVDDEEGASAFKGVLEEILPEGPGPRVIFAGPRVVTRENG